MKRVHAVLAAAVACGVSALLLLLPSRAPSPPPPADQPRAPNEVSRSDTGPVVLPPSGVGLEGPGPVPKAEERGTADHRARLGGTIESAAEQFRKGRRLQDWMGTARRVTWDHGTEGLVKALTLWQESLGAETVPNRGALWLARSQADSAIDRGKEGASHLVDAVLAMERERLQVADGEPRLLGFALPPNSAPLGADEWDANRWARASWREPDYGMSGAAGWGGGSALAWWANDGDKYFAFVLGVAADDARPEEAMAATIWAHAVVLGFGWRRFPHDLPPAGHSFLKECEIPSPPEGAQNDWWRRAFEDAWGMALERRDPAAERLKAWRETMRALPDRRGLAGWKSDYAAFALWSLGEEFRVRFAAVDTPKAKALRELADRLLR